ncbi:conserved hypothetical protein [Shewanella denitrificans OS217]|jgi:uncharacterized membrane protein SirB2|uniref:Invasion gene expression up-regulator, SirB n=1 Tax=Shewanella denitrificans (strain OS217 / ATCC BAA-1090 / DSM 15013) TaxID=318161 RepID=Q12MT8_SHEDO|nr:SirB2 family protein [Shewanella denitrificans]ABE55238.1 conserved hypothetical protein [Shewanella denitrificans OS217]
MYAMLLKTHLILVGLSMFSFILRSSWAYYYPHLLANEIALKSHKIVTLLLLLSALLLCISLGQYPFVDAWLTEKLVLLVLYVAAALMAFNSRLAPKVRGLVIMTACVSLVLMVIIAKTHSSLVL